MTAYSAEPVTLVLPVHNAADTLPPAADAWLTALDRLGRGYELLVVDDGSTDGTTEVVSKLAAQRKHVRVLRHDARRGVGACLRTALAESTHPLIATTALDYPYYPNDLGRMLAAIGRREEIFGRPFEVAVACGCRTGHPTPAVWKWVGRIYRLLSRVLVGYPPAPSPGWLGVREHLRSWLAWVVFGNPLHDQGCALRVYKRSVFDKFPIQSDGGFVHIELVAKLVFTTHLLDEVTLSPSPAAVSSPDWADFWRVFRNPQFTPPADPARQRPDMSDRPRVLFVTGKLAEPALRRTLVGLAPTAEFEADVAVLPITVAALMTTDWIAKRLTVPADTQRVVLPGMCRGDLAPVEAIAKTAVVRGPNDLRDLPEFFGKQSGPPPGYGKFDIEILAEINHAPQLPLAEMLRIARHFRDSGADVIDLGCDPGGPWTGAGDAVRALRADGFRVSIDSFDPTEVEAALAAGAELVLSVNGSNVDHARRWHERFPGVEVVAIPDTPSDLASLDHTIEMLAGWGVKFRADPILEPIGFGLAASLGRYLDVRRKYPDLRLMMGVGNLTELTDVDSAGVNVLLAGFCQEVGIRSVLTTEVINWCRSAVREFDLARRLVYHAVTNGMLPKHLEPGLVMLRDRKVSEHGPAGLAELASRITDRNYRLFAEGGELHVINGSMHLHGADPFGLFAEMERRDEKLDPSHAFYLGYELAKAVTALTLGKQYSQDQALDWGFLTRPETSHRG